MKKADRAREIVPEGIAEIGATRSLRAAVAAALADVEREAMEKCLEILKGYLGICHCDEAWISRDRHAPECTVEDMEDAVAEIRAAFAADEREAPK
jgi:hypothetical protein